MVSRRLINLSLISLRATVEYFTQFGPLNPMPFMWWIMFGLIIWSAAFLIFDAIGERPKKAAKLNLTGRQHMPRLGISLYLGIPLLLIGYFGLRDIAPLTAVTFFGWYAKSLLVILVMIRLRQYLAARYCENKKQEETTSRR